MKSTLLKTISLLIILFSLSITFEVQSQTGKIECPPGYHFALCDPYDESGGICVPGCYPEPGLIELVTGSVKDGSPKKTVPMACIINLKKIQCTAECAECSRIFEAPQKGAVTRVNKPCPYCKSSGFLPY